MNKTAKHQELKDKLWRLDDAASFLSNQTTHFTGRAWKEAVEHGNWERELLAARSYARNLLDRINDCIDDTIVDKPMA